MANDAISDLGNTISLSGGGEEYTPALGDGSCKPGMCVGKLTTGKVFAVDADNATTGKSAIGILDKIMTAGIDVAITDGAKCQIIEPVPGKKYRVFIEDPGAARQKGAPVMIGATTAGSFTVSATISASTQRVATLDKAVANGDTVAEIRWG